MKKVFAYLACALLFFSFAACSSRNVSDLNEEDGTDDQSLFFETAQNQENDLLEIDTSMMTELTKSGYTLEQSSQIQQILNTVGIESIKVEKMTGDAQTEINSVTLYPNGYTDDNRKMWFTTEDGVLFYAGFLNEDLYDSEKGGFLKSYADIHVPETKIDFETYGKLQTLATEAVKSNLKYPSNSNVDEFSWGIGRSDDKYKMQGSVSAENGFGIRKDLFFCVWFIETENGFDVEGITIDGKRVR